MNAVLDFVLAAEARVLTGVRGQDGFPLVDDALDDRAANRKLVLVDRFLFPVARNADAHVPAFIPQHQKAAFRTHQPDDGVHHDLEHLVHFEGGIDHLPDPCQRL